MGALTGDPRGLKFRNAVWCYHVAQDGNELERKERSTRARAERKVLKAKSKSTDSSKVPCPICAGSVKLQGGRLTGCTL